MSEEHAPRSLAGGFRGSGPGATDGMALIGLLVTDAARRLRLFSAIGIGVFAAGALLSLLFAADDDGLGLTRPVMLTLCFVLFLLSILVHLRARRPDARSTGLVRLGLGYVVMAAGAMAGAETLLFTRPVPDWTGVSGMCIWIVLFPLIIPCLPRQAFLTSVASASMLPFAYAVLRVSGGDPVPGDVLVRWWGAVYFCAGLSTAAAISIHRLARSIARAKAEAPGAGRYELVDQLSEGGMGQVWRARHSVLPHDVAVKLIRPVALAGGRADAARDLVRRFRIEAHAVALLRSPHTVRLYDFGVSDSGELFAVMEYLRGPDFGRLVLEHGVQPPGRVIRLLAQVCLSLAEAHGMGLIHRDIKPANLMVCRLGCQSDFVKVLDFGLVGAMSHAPEEFVGEETTATVSGTPGFIPPEALRGEPVDERSDLYALGVVAYWLLTGTTLFPREGGGEELLRHVSDAPEPPADRLGAALPTDLTDLVLRLLAKRPDDRPVSALELRRELLSLADAGAWTAEDADRWWEERAG